MKRFRLPLLIVGVVGALLVAVAVFMIIRLGRGTPVQLPVAIADIPPRTPLSPRLFHLEEVRGLGQATLDAYVTADRFGEVVDHETLEMIHAGAPLLWAQVDPERESHLTLALSDPTHLVYPLPVSADEAGDRIVAGDYVDVIFTLGRVAAQEMSHVETWEYEGPASAFCRQPVTETTTICPGDLLSHTTTLQLPLAKVVLPDVQVLRVEREQVRSASASYGMGTEETTRQTVEGEIVRLYLEVDREQAEVLSFALHNGGLNLPAHARPIGGQSEGFTWQDFERLFFQGRPDEELRGE